jgi:hypothetical protein
VTADAGRRLTLTAASQIQPERTQWAFRGRVPLGHLTLLSGQPKLGKSTWALDLAAQLSRGEADGDLKGHPIDVAILSYEDHGGATVVPRLIAAGADLDRVHLVDPTINNGGGSTDLITLPRDVDAVAAECERVGARFLVIDPLMASLAGSTDAHRDQDIRRALAPLAQLAKRLILGLLVITHTNKARDGDMIRRIGASVGLSGAARSLLVMGPTPSDPDGADGSGRVLIQRGNLGGHVPALAYRIASTEIEHQGESIETSRLALIGETEVQAHDLLAPPDPDEQTDTDIAREWLTDFLADGEWRGGGEVKAAARQEGITQKVLRRAREQLDIEIERRGMPAHSYWRLPVVPSLPKSQGIADRGTTDNSASQREEDATDLPVMPPRGLGAQQGIKSADSRQSPPCRYPAHRGSDYTGNGGKQVCGVCHPRCPSE